MNNPKTKEQEQAYIVLTTDPKSVAETLLAQDSLGDYELSEPEVHTIVDTYYDTPDNDLRMSTVTLRTRVLDGELYITFKGKEQSDDFTQDHNEWDFLSPFDEVQLELFTSAAGLMPVQRRETTRISHYLDLVAEYDGEAITSERVAELNFDNSLYTVSTGQARVYMIEFERQGGPSMKKLKKQLNKVLIKDLELPLIPWPHGKFVTGKAIEFGFGVTADENKNLSLDSFASIEKMFQQLKVKTS